MRVAQVLAPLSECRGFSSATDTCRVIDILLRILHDSFSGQLHIEQREEGSTQRKGLLNFRPFL